MFKAPKSLGELQKLNSGVFSGFSQVGKFITVYPPSAEAAVVIANKLNSLIGNQPAPTVPYDNVLQEGSCVYYRYGSFSWGRKMTFRGKRVFAMKRMDGKLVRDRRQPRSAVPGWVSDPFQRVQVRSRREAATPLETTYRDYKALVQRGRGGVYRALDVSCANPRSCILKEGRRHGETDWSGRDGFDRLQCEARFLRAVSRRLQAVPRLITTFRANNCFYLVMEPVTGRSLQSVIVGRERISKRRALAYCASMARIVADIHAAGWAWRDCKPGNFLCQKRCKLRALDFEGASPIKDPDPLAVATPGYLPRQWQRVASDPRAADLYALGISIMELIARKISPTTRLAAAFKREIRKQKLPEPLCETILRLRSPKSKTRSSAREVQQMLEELLHRPNGS